METGSRDGDGRPFGFLSRRKFLYGALGAASAASGLGLMGTWWLRGEVPPVEGLQALSPFEFRVVTDIVDATFPPDGPIDVDVTELDLPRAFDRFVGDQPPLTKTDLSRALMLVEVAPLLWDGKRTTFSRLGRDERAAYWATWGASERLVQRQVSLSLRKFLNMLFYNWADVWPHIGYGGPSLARLQQRQP